jgi:hypothetical protein
MTEELETTQSDDGIKYETYKVESSGKEVGIARYPIYSSLKQAISEIGDNTCLKLVNAQVKTNELNRVRAANAGEMTQNRFDEAVNDIMNSADVLVEKIQPLLSQIQAEVASGALTADTKISVFKARRAQIYKEEAQALYNKLTSEGKNLSKVSLPL